MTNDQEKQLTERLKQEGKVKGFMDKRLDQYVSDGLRLARQKEVGKENQTKRPMMGEHSRSI